MEPIKLGLFPNTDKLKVVPKPVIRIVFALAAVEAGVDYPPKRERDLHHGEKYTTFDVWCAGLGNKAFKHIDADLVSYRLLLDRSRRSHDAFHLPKEGGGHDDTRLVRGSFRRRMAPLTAYDDAHHAIHLRKSKSAA